jgi:hypothetical protein
VVKGFGSDLDRAGQALLDGMFYVVKAAMEYSKSPRTPEVVQRFLYAHSFTVPNFRRQASFRPSDRTTASEVRQISLAPDRMGS